MILRLFPHFEPSKLQVTQIVQAATNIFKMEVDKQTKHFPDVYMNLCYEW